MINRLYSVLDLKAQLFSPVMTVRAEIDAIRQFQDILKDPWRLS